MKAILFFFFAVITLTAFTQNITIDSLQKVLQNQKDDTAKVNTLDALAHEFKYINTDTAMYFAHAVLALATKLNYEIAIANSKREICSLCADQGKYDEGVESGNQALILYNRLLSSSTRSGKEKILKSIALTYTLIGHNRFSQGNYPEALKNTLIASKMSEKLKDKGGISLNEFNIGNIYFAQHNYSQALKYFHTALKITEELRNKGMSAYIYCALGLLYFEQGKYQEATENYSTALKMAEKVKDSRTIEEAYNALGLLADKQGNYNEALKYDFVALQLYGETGVNEQIPLIYNNIALVYMKQKKYNDASKYLDKALSYAKEIGSLLYIKLSYENLAAFDSTRGNYKKALENYKLAITYSDSLFNDKNTKKMVQQEMQYDLDKREDSAKSAEDKREAIAKAEIQNQKTIRNFSYTGAFAVLSFAGVGFYRYKKRRKLQSRQEMLNERLRISRELHDDIGSTLGSISIYSEVAKNRSEKNENAEETIAKIGNASRELIDKMSDIVWSMNPNNESYEQLINRIQVFAAIMLTPHEILYTIHTDEAIKKIKLTAEERKNIYLIYKEAIHNVIKYAECTQVEIRLFSNADEVVMTIKDNGKGFNINNVKLTSESLGGNGIKNMQARAESINGRFNIQSSAGTGTIITSNLKV